MLRIESRKPKTDLAVITVSGRMMLGENNQQLETLIESLAREGCRHFVFELSGLTHIDSTGIGRFIAAYRRTMADGGSLKMAAATAAVRAAFRVTRLDSVFPFFDSVEAAMA